MYVIDEGINSLQQQIQKMADDVLQQHPNLRVSDMFDAQGHQFVDLVMEGGTMHGIALLGYIALLEKLKIRFLGIGGTSAGSIVALLLTSIGSATDEKSAVLLNILLKKNFLDFLDGENVVNALNELSDIYALYKQWNQSTNNIPLAFKIFTKLKSIPMLYTTLKNGYHNLGFNSGNHFTKWLTDILSEQGISTLNDLQDKINQPIDTLYDYRSKLPIPLSEQKRKFIAVTADITTRSKVELPRMAHLYWKDTDQVSPAEFVRCSMSIPVVFYPIIKKDLPRELDLLPFWQQNTALHPRSTEDIPESITFVDGGIMSNFPIDLFHDTSVIPKAPTFGVKLGKDHKISQTSPAGYFLMAIFEATSSLLDYDFIKRNKDYHHLLTYIDIDSNKFSSLNFNMNIEDKISLVLLGAEEAKKFIVSFDWEHYRKLREKEM